MVNFGPLTAEIEFGSLGHPYTFQRVLRLGSATARHYSSGRQPNFPAFNRGRHLYSTGRPSRWALAHILAGFSFFIIFLFGSVRQIQLAILVSFWEHVNIVSRIVSYQCSPVTAALKRTVFRDMGQTDGQTVGQTPASLNAPTLMAGA